MALLEKFFGIIAALLFVSTAGMAVLTVSSLIIKGPAETTTGTVIVSAGHDEDTASLEPTEPVVPVAAPAAATEAHGVTLADGEAAYRQCRSCHTVDQGGANRVGPNLWNIVGRAAGSVEGFRYSTAMADHGAMAWDAASLDAFLTDPQAVVPGNAMTFRGVRDADTRHALIYYLSQQADAPVAPETLGFAVAGFAGAGASAEPVEVADAAVEILPVPYPEGVTYANPPARSAEEIAAAQARAANIEALVDRIDYERARFHELHFPPAIATASNEECLACHSEIMTREPRPESPAGVEASEVLAWYQTLDTYEGDQETFHYRHLQSDFAQEVMNLQCTFCHQGNDPREETPDMMPGREPFSAGASPEFTLRKHVNPSETCLRCHGAFPEPEIMGLSGPWHEVRADFEYPDAPNGCLSCHAESFRTERHAVTYLNAANIEELARQGSSDSCYGCHGGRAWYRISYPYPRHAWPTMFDDETPAWAQGRPTDSDARFILPRSAD